MTRGDKVAIKVEPVGQTVSERQSDSDNTFTGTE